MTWILRSCTDFINIDVYKRQRLFHYGDDVYMVRDFPMTGINRLGTLFYKLSPEAFRQLAAGRQALSGRILVMDAGGEELFGGPVPGGDGGDGLARHGKGMAPREEMRIARDMDGYADNGEGLTFRVTSALTGWGYVLLEDHHLFAPEISDILLLILPLLIMFFFVSLFLSLYITRTKMCIRDRWSYMRLLPTSDRAAQPYLYRWLQR